MGLPRPTPPQKSGLFSRLFERIRAHRAVYTVYCLLCLISLGVLLYSIIRQNFLGIFTVLHCPSRPFFRKIFPEGVKKYTLM